MYIHDVMEVSSCPCQDALAELRTAFHQVECPLRPRIFLAMPLEDQAQSDDDVPGQASGLEESMSSPEKNLEKTNVLYLKMDAAVRGVLQVHQVGQVGAAIEYSSFFLARLVR